MPLLVQNLVGNNETVNKTAVNAHSMCSSQERALEVRPPRGGKGQHEQRNETCSVKLNERLQEL
ncbi:MAG: hypothetical protein ACPIOQ_54285 [Promethearchaeia archaeon]